MHRIALHLVVFWGGMVTLGVELAASRLLAPFFGTSTLIWAVLIGMILITIFSWSVWKMRYRKTAQFFKKLQVVSAAYVSLTHGMNDAQKTMGIIAMALFSKGLLGDTFHIPIWVVIIC